MLPRAVNITLSFFVCNLSNAVSVSKECFDLAFMWAITGPFHYGASGAKFTRITIPGSSRPHYHNTCVASSATPLPRIDH